MSVLVFDVETTGFSATNDRIIEFGAVAFDDSGEVIGRVDHLINPGIPIPYRITEITGITQGMIDANGIPWEEFSKKAQAWLEAAPVWCGQNLAFDKKFVNAEMARVGIELPEKPYVDTLAVCRRFVPADVLKSKTLGNMAAYYGVTLSNAHRAVDDAEATGRILFKLMKEIDMTLEQLISGEAIALGQLLIGEDPFEAQFSGNAVKRG